MPARLGDRTRTVRVRPEGERGAGSLEYTGVIAVGAIVVCGLLLGSTEVGPRLGMLADHAACEVGSATGWTGGCENTPLKVSERMVPTECTVASSGERKEGDVSIAVVDLGIGRGVDVKEVRRKDGSTYYLVTVNNDGEAGLGTGAGGGLKKGKKDLGEGVNAGFQVDLSGKGIYVDGKTYKVEGTREDAKALAQSLYDHGNDGAGDHQPHLSSTTWAGEGKLSGDAGLTGSYNRTDKKGRNKEGEVTGVSIAGSGTAKHSWESSYNHETQETKYVNTWSGKLDGEMQLEVGGMKGTMRGWGSTVAITRDKDNKITGIEIIQIQESSASGNAGVDHSEKYGTKPEGDAKDKRNSAGGKIGGGAGASEKTITKIKLDVNDSNRGTVDTWLGQQVNWGKDWMPVAPFGTYGWDPTQQSTDPMVKVLHEQAQVTRTVTEDSRTTEEIGASIKWGLKFGASYTHTDTEGKLISAEYADLPVDGKRGWKVMDVCF